MNAAVCYVYLSDVSEYCPRLSDEGFCYPRLLQWIPELEESRWFTRGWTLQELIAPRQLHFFGRSWNYIGSLSELIQCVSGITGIQTDVLDGTRPLADLSIACRLSWAAKRQTSRTEDQAYSLFGILNVNMPLLYGEGRRAFIRLQEEIIRQSTDQSIFAWDAPSGFIGSRELLLAPSPACFVNGSRICRRLGTAIDGESAYTISNKGLEINLPIIERTLEEDLSHPYVTLAILDCQYEGSNDPLAIVAKQHPFSYRTASVELYVSGYEMSLGSEAPQYRRIYPVKLRAAARAAHKQLTITRDLQSQNYIHAFSTNPNWFPLCFMGDVRRYMPTVEGAYPEPCWSRTSQTMRLRNPEYTYGGIVVRIQEINMIREPEVKHVLIAFGLDPLSSEGVSASRKIYSVSYINQSCPIEPHLRWLSKAGQQPGVDGAGIALNGRQRIVAQLWNGALSVSIENSGEVKAFRTHSIHSLSPPPSPMMTKRHSSFPTISRHNSLPRRDSVLSDGGSQHSQNSQSSQENAAPSVHWTSQCENCRHMEAQRRADRRREEEKRRQRLHEEEARRRKQETQRQFVKGAKKGATALTGLGILTDVAEIALGGV